MTRLLLLNGPNLNLLGTREPGLYGAETLAAIERRATQLAREEGRELLCFQSNAEHELIGRIHQAAAEKIGVLIFNPGAFTHTSIALRDAVLGVRVPMIELHLSNPQARELFRRRSYFADIAVGLIAGFGPLGYELAVRAACRYLADAVRPGQQSPS
ncbi:MAG TPA: type II 3-dehydroquinate dehydratase [Steroidobacteraceae bacterium]|jgi:3-dehydroquinate dehydratase-2